MTIAVASFALVLCVESADGTQDREVSVLLSAGQEGGAYYEAARRIKALVEKEYPEVDILVRESRGSNENLDRLRNSLADWAILQRDIAADAYYATQEPFRNFRVLMPLFPEAFHVVVRRPAAPQANRGLSLSDFVVAVQRGEIKSIAIGPEGSGSNKNARSILTLFGVAHDDVVFLEGSYEEAFAAFQAESIDALAVTMAFPDHRFARLAEGADFVGMSEADTRLILQRLTSFDAVSIPAESYPSQVRDARTVGTWAFLVGKRTGQSPRGVLPEGRSLVHSLLSGLIEGEFRLHGQAPPSPEGLPIPASWQDRTFFRGLPLSQDLRNQVSWTRPWFMIALGIAFLVVFGALAVIVTPRPRRLVRSYINDLRVRKHWLRYRHHIVLAGVLVLVFNVSVHLIHFAEVAMYNDSLVFTPFRNMGLNEVRQWLLIFSLSGYDRGLFPVSSLGQITSISMVPVTYCLIGIAVVAEIAFKHHRNRRRTGMERVEYSGHVVICGWNERIGAIVRRYIEARQSFADRRRSLRVVILDSRFASHLKSDSYLQRLHAERRLDYIDGDPKDPRDLEKANVSAAHTIVLLADDRTQDADERTLLRALSISRYCREENERAKRGSQSVDQIYIIAEVNDENFRYSLLEADVNEIVCSAGLGESIMVQSTFNHGLSSVLHDLLAYDSGNEFYLIGVERCPSLVGLSFDDALQRLRREDVLLIAIKVVAERDGEDLIDRDELLKELKGWNLDRPIIANPLGERENAYRIRQEDDLFVLAADESSVETALRRISDAPQSNAASSAI